MKNGHEHRPGLKRGTPSCPSFTGMIAGHGPARTAPNHALAIVTAGSVRLWVSYEVSVLAIILATTRGWEYTLRPHLPLPQEVRQVETRQVICEGRLPLFLIIVVSLGTSGLRRRTSMLLVLVCTLSISNICVFRRRPSTIRVVTDKSMRNSNIPGRASIEN